MSDIREGEREAALDEKELMDIFNGMDEDLINSQIDELLAERGEEVNMDSIKEKSLGKLKKEKKGRGIGKKAAIIAAAAALMVSTAYAKDIQRAVQSFFGKSTVYQTVVDGDAYYLPESLALGEKYTLKYANMSEGRLELAIESTEKMTEDWYESLELSVEEAKSGKSYEAGGYGYFDSALRVLFYEMPTLSEFDVLIGGKAYPVLLTKAESLAVEENLVIGTTEIEESMPLIANVAARRNDEGRGVEIGIAVGFEDKELKLSGIGEEAQKDIFRRSFENDENGSFGGSSGYGTKPLVAYDENNNAYELKEPANAIGRPVTVFETEAAPGTPLTLKVPAVEARFEKNTGKISLDIPKEGEIAAEEEIDFIIQAAVLKTVKRTSPTTAEVVFLLNTGSDKSVRIHDISAYSKDVIKGETITEGDRAVLTLTFDENTESAEIEFNWPHFVIEGNWSIEL